MRAAPQKGRKTDPIYINCSRGAMRRESGIHWLTWAYRQTQISLGREEGDLGKDNLSSNTFFISLGQFRYYSTWSAQNKSTSDNSIHRVLVILAPCSLHTFSLIIYTGVKKSTASMKSGDCIMHYRFLGSCGILHIYSSS